MKRPADLLERHPLFVGLRPEQVARFAAAGSVESFERGDIVVSDGSPGDALYLLLSGTARVVKDERVLATLQPGEFFGEMTVVEPAARSADVVAADDAFMFRLPTFALQTLLEQEPDAFNAVLVQIVRVLSERLRRTNDLLSSVGHLADWLAGSLV